MIACTIIARNYLAHARVFAASFSEHHPGAAVFVLVLDDPSHDIGEGEPFTTVRPADILVVAEFAQMASMYSVVELATAVKPSFLQHLLRDTSTNAVAYFDPDIRVFTPLNDVFAQAEQHGVALTPHALNPLPRGEGVTENEDVILDVGVFNLGFIAVGPTGVPVLDWWASRLRRECVIDPQHGRFVDQRWVDLVPAYFDPAILRDPGMNIAWWNTPQRHLRYHEGRYHVDDGPLRFFHFSGYDPGVPWLLSKHQGPSPRVLLSREPSLAQITAEYGSLLHQHGYADCIRMPYGLDTTSSGLILDGRVRRLYRDALIAAEANGHVQPPCPLAVSDVAFLKWLATPDASASGPHPTSRYLHDLWLTTPDLRQRFPDIHGEDAAAYAAWATADGVTTGAIPPSLAPHVRHPEVTAAPGPITSGAHVIGYLGADSAYGALARWLVRAAAAADLPVRSTSITRGLAPGSHPVPPKDPRLDGSQVLNIFCLDPQRILEGAHLIGPADREGRRHVALIRCPLPDPIELPVGVLDLLDEIWVCSEFARHVVAQTVTSVPISVVPIPPQRTVSTSAPGCERARGTLAFRVAVIADMAEDFVRTNIDGAVHAYTAAFQPDDGAQLVVAVTHGAEDVRNVERLRWMARGRSDVSLYECGTDDVARVIRSAECLLDMARCSDLSLPMLEAMADGCAVIAPVFGGAADVLSENTGWPVPFTMTTLRTQTPSGEVTVAEPDVAAAAMQLITLRGNPTARATKAQCARVHLEAKHSAAAAASFLTPRAQI